MRKLLKFAGWLVLAGAVLVIILGLWFTVLFTRPKRTLPEETPTAYNLTYESLTLMTADNERLAAWYIPAPDADGRVVIYVHGRSGNRGQLLPIAAELHEAGYGALLFDMRTHGESTGGELTYGINEVLDVQTAVDFLLEQPDVNAARIAIVGHSLGASISVMAAAQIDELAAVVALSPYSSITEVIGDRAWQNRYIPPRPTRDLIVLFVGTLTRRDYAQSCPKCVLADIAPRPVLLVHGDQDDVVPPQSLPQAAEALQEAGWKDVFAHVMKGTAHGIAPDGLSVALAFMR
ncbi:MAG: alpha/beta fold hydrolase, partial [Chloroflexota bacterium]